MLSIKPYRNSGKYQINFMEPNQLINPIRLTSEYVPGLAGHRYSWVQRLFEAKLISDLKPWGWKGNQTWIYFIKARRHIIRVLLSDR
jgi:hypothetical protein